MGRSYTEEEIEILSEMAGFYSYSAIAKKLNRSVAGVELKLKRLGFGATKELSGRLNANQLANICNVDIHAITNNWIKKRGLKATRKITRKEFKFWLIDPEDFWKWAKKNKDIINFAKIEKDMILPEPAWVDEERKKDYHTIPKRQNAKWTKEEDLFLIQNIDHLTQKEIGDRLNRSQSSVQRRLSRLREWKKAPPKKIVVKWSEKEVEMLLEMDAKGIPDTEIAWELGREVDHIRDKRRNMRENGEYPGYKKDYQRQQETKRILELYCSGRSKKQIAAEVGLHEVTVHRRLKDYF